MTNLQVALECIAVHVFTIITKQAYVLRVSSMLIETRMMCNIHKVI